MCGKRSCYKRKYLVIGVEGFEVGCFWRAHPSDYILGTPESLQWWFIKDLACPAVLAKDPEIPWDYFLDNKVSGVEGSDKGYSILSDVVSSVTLQNFSPWFGLGSFPSPSNEVIRISACCKKGLHFCCLNVEVSVITTDTQSEKLTIRYGWLATVRMGWTEVEVRVAIRGFVMCRSGYAISLRPSCRYPGKEACPLRPTMYIQG